MTRISGVSTSKETPDDEKEIERRQTWVRRREESATLIGDSIRHVIPRIPRTQRIPKCLSSLEDRSSLRSDDAEYAPVLWSP